jgi:hypothetical protein
MSGHSSMQFGHLVQDNDNEDDDVDQHDYKHSTEKPCRVTEAGTVSATAILVLRHIQNSRKVGASRLAAVELP